MANVLLLLLFFLFPLGQLEKLPLDIPGVSVYVHDLVLIAIWVYFVIPNLFRNLLIHKRKILKQVQYDETIKRFWLFTGIALVSWIINLFHWGSQSVIGLMYLIRWTGLFGVYFLIKIPNSKSQVPNKSQIQNSKFSRSSLFIIRCSLLSLLRSTIFFTAVFGVVQYLLFPDLRFLRYFGGDDHYFRMTGTFLDPNFFGLMMVIGLGLEILNKFQIQNHKFQINPKLQIPNLKFTIFKYFKILFYLICLALTYSRASWLAWGVLLVGWTISRIFCEPIKFDALYLLRVLFRPLKLTVTGCLLFVSLLFFYFVPRPYGEGGNLLRTASIVARENNWSQSWQVIKKNWLFGVGFNNYQLANPTHQKADNSLLLVWATTGIFGLAAFLWLIFTLKPFWLILPIIIHSFFNNSLFYPWVLILVWVIVC